LWFRPTGVIKATNNLIAEKYSEQYKKGHVSIVAIGKKSQDFYEKRNYHVIGNNNEVYAALTFENVTKITDSIMAGFKKGDFDKVELVYNRFKNAAVQILTTEQLLLKLKLQPMLIIFWNHRRMR
jgi:F-type H+-transporting ATPase subunit gamma